MKSVDDDSKSRSAPKNDGEIGFRRIADSFRSVDLVLPPYFGLGGMSALSALIEKQPTSELKQGILKEILPLMYGDECLATFQVGIFATVPFVRDFKLPICQAIEAAAAGMHHAAVSTLLPVLEGTILKAATAQGSPIRAGNSKQLIGALDQILAKENASLNPYFERVAMLESLRDFFQARLLVPTNSYSGFDQLNRHGILHGLYEGYGADTNFFRLIALLSLVCFALRLSYGGSMFAPAKTSESIAFADHLARIRLVAKGRPEGLYQID